MFMGPTDRRWIFPVMAFVFWVAAQAATGQVVLDGTVGPSGPLSGPVFSITDDLGTQEGPNLLHSFSQFDLGIGEVANFTGPASVENIISRVTGGNVSNIDGLVRSTIPGANFLLINPDGVVFGPNAQVDVSGAFVVTTSQVLKLADGRQVHALDPESTVLTTAPPSAFGFLTNTPAAITTNGTSLTFTNRQTVSIIGGDVQIVGGRIGRPVICIAPACQPPSRVNVISVASAGEVVVDAPDPASPVDVASFTAMGDVNVSAGVEIDLASAQSGATVVRARDLTLDSSNLSSETGVEDGGDIDIALDGTLELNGGAKISTTTLGLGDAGNVRIEAETVRVLDRSQVLAVTEAQGDGGDIEVVARDTILLDRLVAEGTTADTGISAQSCVIAPGDEVVCGPDPANVGDGGNIRLEAGLVRIVDQAKVFANTLGAGDGGNISVAADIVEIDGETDENGMETGIFAQTLAASDGGPGGNIDIAAGAITLIHGVLDATSFGSGRGGGITLTADLVSLDAGGGGNTGIAAATLGFANDGNDGGDVVILGRPDLFVLDGAFITVSSSGSGDGGGIDAMLRVLTIDNGLVASSSTGTGTAGEISIDADTSVWITGGVPGDALSGLVSVTVASAASDAGEILIRAGSTIDVFNTTISASAFLDGGNITFEAVDRVRIVNSTITGLAGSDGGQITIDPLLVILDRSTIDGRAGGQPVFVSIDQGAIFFSSESRILTTTVSLPPQLDLSGTLLILATSLESARARLVEQCVVRLQTDTSSFIISGRGGLPIEPGHWLPGFDHRVLPER